MMVDIASRLKSPLAQIGLQMMSPQPLGTGISGTINRGLAGAQEFEQGNLRAMDLKDQMYQRNVERQSALSKLAQDQEARQLYSQYVQTGDERILGALAQFSPDLVKQAQSQRIDEMNVGIKQQQVGISGQRAGIEQKRYGIESQRERRLQRQEQRDNALMDYIRGGTGGRDEMALPDEAREYIAEASMYAANPREAVKIGLENYRKDTEAPESVRTNAYERKIMAENALTTIEKIRPLLTDETVGLIGSARSGLQNITEQGKALIGLADESVAQSRAEVQGTELESFFDPRLPKLPLMENDLAYKLAQSRKGSRLNLDDMKQAKKDVGITGGLASGKSANIKLNQIEEEIRSNMKQSRDILRGRFESKKPSSDEDLIWNPEIGDFE